MPLLLLLHSLAFYKTGLLQLSSFITSFVEGHISHEPCSLRLKDERYWIISVESCWNRRQFLQRPGASWLIKIFSPCHSFSSENFSGWLGWSDLLWTIGCCCSPVELKQSPGYELLCITSTSAALSPDGHAGVFAASISPPKRFHTFDSAVITLSLRSSDFMPGICLFMDVALGLQVQFFLFIYFLMYKPPRSHDLIFLLSVKLH